MLITRHVHHDATNDEVDPTYKLAYRNWWLLKSNIYIVTHIKAEIKNLLKNYTKSKQHKRKSKVVTIDSI